MEFTEFVGSKYSETAGEFVSVLKYESKHKVPYCNCTRCGKPIKKTMYVVQSADTGVELMYLGADCINKLN